MKILILTVMAVWSLTVCGQATTLQNRQFVRVDRIGEATARSFFIFSTNSLNYAVRHDGHSESYATNVRRKNFDLKMNGGRLEKLYFLEEGADVFLLYEVTDGRSGWAYLTRLDQKTAKQKYCVPVNAINVGIAVMEGEFAYVPALNFVAKMDLLSGKSVWEVKDITQGESSDFQIRTLTTGRIVLREDKEEGREIEIDKASGRIVKP